MLLARYLPCPSSFSLFDHGIIPGTSSSSSNYSSSDTPLGQRIAPTDATGQLDTQSCYPAKDQTRLCREPLYRLRLLCILFSAIHASSTPDDHKTPWPAT